MEDFFEDKAKKDEKFMRMAIDEARKALAKREVPIGAVVVVGDRVVGRGHNLVETLADAYDGFPAQVTIRNCRDCKINVYPSQTKIIGDLDEGNNE